MTVPAVGSSIPAALDALVTLWQAANITGLQVIDGPAYDVSGSSAGFVAVGWRRDGEAAVTGSSSMNTFSGVPLTETYDITCLLAFWTDNTSMSAARTALFGAYRQLRQVVAANMTLGGVVLNAQTVGPFDVVPDNPDGGASVDFYFTVHVEASI